MTNNERLWRALYWVAMKLDRICPYCNEQLVSGPADMKYLNWHIDEHFKEQP